MSGDCVTQEPGACFAFRCQGKIPERCTQAALRPCPVLRQRIAREHLERSAIRGDRVTQEPGTTFAFQTFGLIPER